MANESKTRHLPDCKRVFNRYDDHCPRCLELKAGASARKGWGRSREDQDRDVRWIHEHFASEKHRSGGCGPVCTFGDY